MINLVGFDIEFNSIFNQLQNNNFPNEEIERERGVILSEIGQSNDTPDDKVFENFTSKAFDGQSLGNPILGTEKSVKSFQKKDDTKKNMLIGLGCSTVSDLLTNPIRILKTYKQSNKENITYFQALREIRESKGLVNFYFRGLGTKIILNGLNSGLFLVLWKKFENY